jgi:hypothetical protein
VPCNRLTWSSQQQTNGECRVQQGTLGSRLGSTRTKTDAQSTDGYTELDRCLHAVLRGWWAGMRGMR